MGLRLSNFDFRISTPIPACKMFTCCGRPILNRNQFDCHFMFSLNHYKSNCFVCVCDKFYSRFNAFIHHFKTVHHQLARGILFDEGFSVRPETQTGFDSNFSYQGNDSDFADFETAGHFLEENSLELDSSDGTSSQHEASSNLSILEKAFLKLLNQLKLETTVTEKHLNLISSKILDFVFCQVDLLNSETFSRLYMPSQMKGDLAKQLETLGTKCGEGAHVPLLLSNGYTVSSVNLTKFPAGHQLNMEDKKNAAKGNVEEAKRN